MSSQYKPRAKWDHCTRCQCLFQTLILQVHLMVAVVGRLFQKWFPAQPNLSYTFIWDKTDAYGQRVYGLSEAVGEFPPIYIFKALCQPAAITFLFQINLCEPEMICSTAETRTSLQRYILLC